jgi:hypothetical protein
MSPRLGLSSRGVLLLILGAGAAAFLLFLFPRLSASRAAERARQPAVEKVSTKEAPGNKDPATLQEPAAIPANDPEPKAAATPSIAPAALAATGQATAETKPRYEGPPLTIVKGGGKSGMVKPRELMAEQREQRRLRAQERAAQGNPVEPAPLQVAPPVERRPIERLNPPIDDGPMREVGKRKKGKGKKNG